MYVDCGFTFSPPSSWMLYLVRLLHLLYCLQRWWTSRQGALSPGPLQQGLLRHYFDLAFEASLLVEASVTAASAGLPFQGSEDQQLCSPVYWKFLQVKLQIFIFKNFKKKNSLVKDRPFCPAYIPAHMLHCFPVHLDN